MKKQNVILYSITSVIALLNTSIYWSVKPIWFFIDKELGNFIGIENFWSGFFWFLFLGLSVYSLCLLIIRKSGIVHSALPILFNILLMVFNIYLYRMLGSEKHIVLRNLKTLIPGLLVTATVLFFIIIFPKMKLSDKTGIRAFAAFLVLLSFFLYFNDSGNIRITSGPNIQYIDENNFAVLWTTNKKSTGWLEFGRDEDHLSEKHLSEKGLIQGNTKVHKVILSGASDESFIFRAGSRNIKDLFQNNVVYGKTVYSEFIEFENNKDNDEISFYVLSDIHEREDLYKKYLSEGDYDFLVLNGDLLSSIDSEDIIINEMLKPVSKYSRSFKPFYFVRGNHETRGASSRELPDYLALPEDSYYYTFNYGPVFAIVLDGGEDKPDSHEEYGGLADFEAYKEEEAQWLKEVGLREDYKNAEFVIAFNHVPLNMYESLEEGSPLKKYEEECVEILNSMEIDVLISGHTHRSDIIEPDGDIYKFPIIIGGGYTKAHSGYEGIKVEVNSDSLNILFVDEEGKLSNAYTINR